MTAPLYGLVLAGGRSIRMGEDKATLAYHGATQLDWAFALLEPFVERGFISVRADQTNDPVRSRYKQIVDTRDKLGPIAGIAAAQQQHPEAAWLVLACDLPFLDAGTLEHLIAERQPARLATAYRSSHDGLPEPLCAIYEPASRAPLAAYLASGKQCPRKFLARSDVALIDEPNPRALDNINTPAEHGVALDMLSRGDQRMRKQLKVQYYALLREQAGRRDDTVETQARNPRELYEELRKRRGLSLSPDMLRVAVNSEFGSWTQPLQDGDTVVFIPPVAGG
jgi:molybdopterin-guanine dinucleotide biosynthesis protein A